MKNVVMLFVILDSWCLVGLTYKFYKKLDDLKLNKNVQYEYTDIYGNKGYSRHCFEQGNMFVCRDVKNVTKVVKYKKVEV